MNNTIREQFEKLAGNFLDMYKISAEDGEGCGEIGEYAHHVTHIAYDYFVKGWQAALASSEPVIFIPKNAMIFASQASNTDMGVFAYKAQNSFTVPLYTHPAPSKDAERLDTKFDELLALQVGWDSYDGAKINPLAVEKAKELLKYLPRWNWQAVPCSMGNIQLESHTKEHDIDIYIEAMKESK